MSLHAVSGKHQDGTAWAKTPPPGGARGSRWEAAILELAEAGEPRFVNERERNPPPSGVV